MTGTLDSGAAKILVVSDDPSDASQVTEHLLSDFPAVRAATNKATPVADFESILPDVLVLAFKELGKAQEYLVGVLKLGSKARFHKFRTVLLCEKGDVARAFELCKKGHFDDYVLYWPLSYEGPRLPMCVWVAVRALAAVSVKPTEAELRAHLAQLGETADVVAEAFETGTERIEATKNAFRATESSINTALDQLRAEASGAHGEANVSPAMADLAERLRLVHESRVRPALSSANEALTPVEEWSRNFRGQLGEKLAQTSEFITTVGARRPTLLVVDDDPLARKVAAAALAGSRYALLFAGDADEAVLAIGSTLPDLILMDVNLPGMDGVALTKKLKSMPGLGHTPVLMLTGDARPEIVSRSVGAGASSFLVKPYTRASLLSKLDTLLKPKAVS